MATSTYRVLFALLALAGTAGCSDPCKALTESVCNDLGEDDCKKWKKVGSPGVGASKEACTTQLDGATYKATLMAAQASVAPKSGGGRGGLDQGDSEGDRHNRHRQFGERPSMGE